MNNLFRRFRARLSARLSACSGKKKVVPYLSEEDVDSQYGQSIGGQFGSFNSQPSFNGLDADFMKFLQSLNVECSIRYTARTQHRCHDAHAVAYFTLSEYAKSPDFNELLNFLKATHSSEERGISLTSVQTSMMELRDLVEEIHRALKGPPIFSASSLPLGDEAGAVVDLALESLITIASKLSVDSRVLNPVSELLKTIHSLFSNLDISDEQSKVIWCQVITKCSQFVEVIISPDSEDERIVTHKVSVQDIVMILQCISPIVTLLRDMVGLPLAAPPIMAFWAVCDSALQSVSYSLLQGHIRSSVAKTCYSAIYRLLASTSPSPQELSALIHSPSLKNSNHYSKQGEDSSKTQHNTTSPTHRNRMQPFTHHPKKLRSASNISIWDRIIYVLVGFQYLLNGAIGADYAGSPSLSLSQPFPRLMEWITALGEALLTSVQSTASRQLRNSSQLIAELLFLAVLSSPPGQKGGTSSAAGPRLTELTWLFLELTEQVNKFNDSYLKKNNFITRLLQLSSGISSKASTRPHSTGANAAGANSCRSLDSGSDMNTGVRPRRYSTGNGAINGARLYSPLVGGGQSVKDSPGRSSVNSEHTMFNVGDCVDALCTVQNGTQRWFPGTVTARFFSDQSGESSNGLDSPAPLSFVYTILFNDGDVKENVASSDVRMTKNRSRAPSRMSSSRRDSLQQQQQHSQLQQQQVHQHQHSLHTHSNSHTQQPTAASFTAAVVRGLEASEVGDRSATTPGFDYEKTLSSTSLAGGIATIVSARKGLSPMEDLHINTQDVCPTDKAAQSLESIKSGEVHRSNALGSASDIFETPKKVYSPVQFLSKSGRFGNDSLGSISIDDNLEYEDDDDDDSVFVIPMVYSRQGSAKLDLSVREKDDNTSKSGVVVPRMQLDNLDLVSSIDHGGSAASLSGALLRENSKPNLFSDSLDSLTPRGQVDRILGEFAKDDSSVGSLTRIESWRDSVGWSTRRSSGHGLPKSSRLGQTAYSSTNSMMSLLPLSTTQSSQEALKIIQVALTDIQNEITEMESICGTFEVIASFILYGAMTELTDHNMLMTSKPQGLCGGTSVNEENSALGHSTSNASANALSHEVSHDNDEFDDAPDGVGERLVAHTALFAVREFLDLQIASVSAAQLFSTASFIGPDAVRLLKLLSKVYFSEACVALHLKSFDRLSAGAFGSVFKVCCPSECTMSLKGTKDAHYAVKRITRERSIHDTAVVLNIFSEISCLERLSTCPGVCDLIDFGVFEGEYWIVMEKGTRDMHEWVLGNMSKYAPDVESGSTTSAASHPVESFLITLCLFAECVKIVQHVHAERIVHFDIKCSNFIIRKEPDLNDLLDALHRNTLSGCVFLADFGESLSGSEKHFFNSKNKRSRGTLPIQSPEMLSVNDGNEVKLKRSNYVPTAAPSYGCDVWSLGCMAFEVFTGHFLFEEKSWTEMYCLLCMENFKLPPIAHMLLPYMQHDDLPGVGSACSLLARIVGGALQQHPDDRTKISDMLYSIKDAAISLIPHRPIRSDGTKAGSEKLSTAKSLTKEQEVAIRNQQWSISRNILSLEAFPIGQSEPRRDSAVVPKGVWLVGSSVSLSIGFINDFPSTTEGGQSSVSQKKVPSLNPLLRSGVVASLSPLYAPAHMKHADKTHSSLHEFVMTMSAIVSHTSITPTSPYNDMVFKRMIMRCIGGQFSSSCPSLSYYTMYARKKGADSPKIVSTLIDENNACVTLHSEPTPAQVRCTTASVSIIRIGEIKVESKAALAEQVRDSEFANGSLSPVFLSTSQHHCLMADDLDYKGIRSRTMSALRYALQEVASGKCVAYCVDSCALGSHTYSPRCMSNAEDKAKVEVTRTVLTVAIFLSCAVGTIHAYSLSGAGRGKTRSEFISEFGEKEFRWCLASIDTELFRQLCAEIDECNFDGMSGVSFAKDIEQC